MSSKPSTVVYTCGTCGTPRTVKYRQGTINYHKDCHSCAGRKNNPARWSTTHGGYATKLYRMWCGMKNRCYTPSNVSYLYYGGKGIRICSDWLDFPKFRAWSELNGYKETESLELHRRDGNKDYCPNNCVWLSKAEHRRKAANATFSILDVAVIKRLLADGHRPFHLAKVYEVNPCLISSIKLGNTWAWVEAA